MSAQEIETRDRYRRWCDEKRKGHQGVGDGSVIFSAIEDLYERLDALVDKHDRLEGRFVQRAEMHQARLTALEQQSRDYQEDGALAAGRGAGPRTIAQQAHALAAMAEDDYWQGRAEKAEAQRDTARAALRKYGKHWPNCAGVRDAPHNYPWCICGLREALAGGEANEGSGE